MHFEVESAPPRGETAAAFIISENADISIMLLL
jgi:hypothetical protein